MIPTERWKNGDGFIGTVASVVHFGALFLMSYSSLFGQGFGNFAFSLAGRTECYQSIPLETGIVAHFLERVTGRHDHQHFKWPIIRVWTTTGPDEITKLRQKALKGTRESWKGSSQQREEHGKTTCTCSWWHGRPQCHERIQHAGVVRC